MTRSVPRRPRLRPLAITPCGPKEELLLSIRDPEGFGRTLVVPWGAAVLATLMNGRRTLAEIQRAFRKRTGVSVPLENLEEVVRRLDDACLLANARFEQHRREEIESYFTSPVRAPRHADGAYADEPEALREQLAGFFRGSGGPGPIGRPADPADRSLCGLVSPHIDPHRGGPAFAWAYKQVVERSDADLFVIFGTAHTPVGNMFCVSRKDFATPLGAVRTDQGFIDRLAAHLSSSVAGHQIDLFEDELVHRCEHSIEFQAVFLQYVLGGRREFRMVPVLVGSFHEFLASGTSPDDSPEIEALVAAMREAAAGHPGQICYVSGADLAHVGRQFGDAWALDEGRLADQAADDALLLEAVCRQDPAGLFRHVAAQGDRRRICGLAPLYAMLAVMKPARGELLRYDQAVEPDGTACVTFASAAFYRS